MKTLALLLLVLVLTPATVAAWPVNAQLIQGTYVTTTRPTNLQIMQFSSATNQLIYVDPSSLSTSILTDINGGPGASTTKLINTAGTNMTLSHTHVAGVETVTYNSPAFGAVASLGASNSNGVASTVARSDHVHKGVQQLLAGAGIGLTGTTVNPTVTNSGVTSIIAGTNVTVDHSTGDVTVNASGGGGGSGNVYTAGLTVNTLPVATGNTTLTDSGISDDGTTVNVSDTTGLNIITIIDRSTGNAEFFHGIGIAPSDVKIQGGGGVSTVLAEGATGGAAATEAFIEAEDTAFSELQLGPGIPAVYQVQVLSASNGGTVQNYTKAVDHDGSSFVQIDSDIGTPFKVDTTGLLSLRGDPSVSEMRANSNSQFYNQVDSTNGGTGQTVTQDDSHASYTWSLSDASHSFQETSSPEHAGLGYLKLNSDLVTVFTVGTDGAIHLGDAVNTPGKVVMLSPEHVGSSYIDMESDIGTPFIVSTQGTATLAGADGWGTLTLSPNYDGPVNYTNNQTNPHSFAIEDATGHLRTTWTYRNQLTAAQSYIQCEQDDTSGGNGTYAELIVWGNENGDAANETGIFLQSGFNADVWTVLGDGNETLTMIGFAAHTWRDGPLNVEIGRIEDDFGTPQVTYTANEHAGFGYVKLSTDSGNAFTVDSSSLAQLGPNNAATLSGADSDAYLNVFALDNDGTSKIAINMLDSPFATGHISMSSDGILDLLEPTYSTTPSLVQITVRAHGGVANFVSDSTGYVSVGGVDSGAPGGGSDGNGIVNIQASSGTTNTTNTYLTINSDAFKADGNGLVKLAALTGANAGSFGITVAGSPQTVTMAHPQPNTSYVVVFSSADANLGVPTDLRVTTKTTTTFTVKYTVSGNDTLNYTVIGY